jgi:Uma2 family endonuclease
MTLEEFLQLPEEEVALEYADGEVTQKVSPKGRHSRLQFKIPERINAFAEPSKLALAFPELRTTFAGASRVPDVSVYTWDRIQRLPNGRVADDFLTPPDIAIEIVSPEQRVGALIRRCVWFVGNGVRVAVLVDPDDESVVVFRPGAEPLTLRGGDAIDLTDVLPGFHLTVDEVFGFLVIG